MKARNALIPTVVLTAALLAPSALAQRSDDRAGTRGPGVIAATQSSIRPDDRGGTRGPGEYASERGAGTSVRPDDRTGARGPGGLTPSVVEPTSTGFDWGDAFIGGLCGVGIALVLMGTLFLVTSRRSKPKFA
jgi:hypothetical protein